MNIVIVIVSIKSLIKILVFNHTILFVCLREGTPSELKLLPLYIYIYTHTMQYSVHKIYSGNNRWTLANPIKKIHYSAE